SQEMALERVSYKGMGFYRQREGVFQKVLEALTRLEWIEICHHQIATPPQACWVNILPLHLVNYINKWYLIAEKEGRLRTYSLSRITEIRKGKNQGTPAFSTEEIKEKLEEVFGIFVTDEEHPLEEITLRCLPQRTPFFESWVFHPKQEQKRDREGRLEIRFLSTVNRELIGEIVRFADQLEVLGPPTLQRELSAFLDRAARLQGSLP
ncbi:MAG TPA: WYL domain-containing protein, partial [Candidatus Aminicenantes bacterium]|nr:WYL domain-containing protein [Candidatus Aminicenantes bacterium]